MLPNSHNNMLQNYHTACQCTLLQPTWIENEHCHSRNRLETSWMVEELGKSFAWWNCSWDSRVHESTHSSGAIKVNYTNCCCETVLTRESTLMLGFLQSLRFGLGSVCMLSANDVWLISHFSLCQHCLYTNKLQWQIHFVRNVTATGSFSLLNIMRLNMCFSVKVSNLAVQYPLVVTAVLLHFLCSTWLRLGKDRGLV